MKRVPSFLNLGLALALAGSAALAAEWGVSKAVPPFEAFWVKPPAADPGTVFLWSFDAKAAVTDETMDKLLDADEAAEDNNPFATRDSVPCERKGDAADVAGGRYGGALQLAGKGAASAPTDPGALLNAEGMLTLDFWVRPDAQAGAAVLCALPGPGGTAVALARTAEGRLSLEVAGKPVFEHPLGLPAETWTHVGLLLSGTQPAVLVNGNPASLPDAARKALAAQLARLRGPITFGADPALERGLSGRLDEVRLSRRERLFYALQAESLADPKAERPLVKGAPWLARELPLVLSCSFDGTVKPEEFAGVAVEGKAEAADFKPGIRGQALDLSRGAAMNVAFAGHKVLPLKEGTIEFWFRPIAWNNFFHGDYLGTDLPWLNVLRFVTKDTEPYCALRALRIAQGRTHKDYAGGMPWVGFHPGRWTHVLCTWSPQGSRVYLDGQPQPIDQAGLMGPLHPFDTQRHERWLKAHADGSDDDHYRLVLAPSRTLIDELRIYPYALVPTEAANAYARFLPDAEKRLVALPYINVEPAYDYYAQWLTLRVGCLPVTGVDPATAALRLLAPDGKTVLLAADRIPLDSALRGTVATNLALPFGTYGVEIETSAADGRKLKAVKLDYVRAQPPWWQNTLGKDRVVPKPWTPIQAQGATLEVWGRRFDVGAGGLPAALTAAGAEVLAGPARLRGNVNGVNVVLATVGNAQLGAVAPDRAEWSGRLQTPGLRAEVRGTLEYDGLAGFTVTLAPDGAATAAIDSLVLEFPLRAEFARQLIVNGGGHNFRAAWDVRMLPAGTGSVWNSRTSKPKMDKGVAVGHFCPVIWVGDDARGLCFFGENDRGWTPNPEQPAQEFVREGDTVLYRMNIITRPLRLEGPREFAFFVQPTPTKPLPPGWRTWNRHAPGKPLANYEVIDAFSGRALTAPADKPSADLSFALEPESWEAAAGHAEWLRAKFGKENPVLMYIDYSWPKLGPTMDDYRHSLWAGTGRMAWCREVEDYFVYTMNEYLKRGLLDGLYIDDTSLGSTRGLYSTAYRMDNGEIQPGFNSLGFRRFLQRLWVLADQQGKRPIAVPHMTWCFEVPALSFADATVNGEDRDIVFPATWRYPQVWSRDELRIMGSPEKWGFVTLWKSGLNAEQAAPGSDVPYWNYRQYRAMHAALFPNEINPMWANYGHATLAPALAAFGMDDPELRFLAPWNLEGKVTAEGASPNVQVCAYVKKGRGLMMVSNLGTNDCEVTVTVDPKPIWGSGATVAFADADCALTPPPSKAADAGELKAAETALGKDLLPDDKAQVSEQDLINELDDKSPADRESERLALKPRGNSVTLVVRKLDFRLLDLRPGN